MSTTSVPQPRRGLSTGVFAIGSSTQEAVLPEQLAQQARWIAEPSVSATLIAATSVAPARSAVVSASDVELGLSEALLDWLGGVSECQVVDVPTSLRRALMCFRAQVVPIASPVLNLGWVALPAHENNTHAKRELESLASEFALRLELWQRSEVLLQLSNETKDAERDESARRSSSRAPAMGRVLCSPPRSEPHSRRSA